MTAINKCTPLSKKLAERRALLSICNDVIERSLALGRLKQPKSMRNLRRWLRRELVKREGVPASGNRSRLIKASLKLLMMSGLLMSGMQVAQAAVAFNKTYGVISQAFINATPVAIDIDGDKDLDVFSGDYHGAIFFTENTGTKESFSFTVRTGADNPFNGIDVGDDSAPTFADIDNDGDYDAFVGEDGGSVKYFENTGADDNPIFTQRTGAANPLNGVAANGRAKPVLVDIDNDKDLDAVVGERSGKFKYYENEGTVDNPTFTERTGVLNPLDGIDVGGDSAPSFNDIDKDGDFDLIYGSYEPTGYYENTGSATNPAFTKRTGHLNPLAGLSHIESAPTLADMDFDGDNDLILGWSYGSGIEYYENIPRIINNGSFTETFEAANPLYGFDVGDSAQPTFADVDNDGDMDVFVGEYNGKLIYFKNTGDAASPIFEQQTGTANPLDAVLMGETYFGAYTSPTFADIDNDGDLDAFIGGWNGYDGCCNYNDAVVVYFENIDESADRTNPIFVEKTGVDNPLDLVNVVSNPTTPVFADIDNDGDLDFFTGGRNVKYFRNIGDIDNPIFEERTGTNNPLDGVTMGYNPALVDFENDGDFDLFMGTWDGKVRYLENIDQSFDRSSPTFENRTGDLNPFNGFDVGFSMTVSAPAFVDIDNDGDQDAFIGEWNGTLNFFRNNPHTGGNSAPTFNSTPTISGTPEVGEIIGLINVATTDADGDHVTLSYQWQADNVDITGATSSIYLLTANESAKLITCNITADDAYGGSTAIITAGVTVTESANAGTGDGGDGGDSGDESGGGGALNPWSLLLLPLITWFRRKNRKHQTHYSPRGV